MPQAVAGKPQDVPVTREVGPGVRLHVWRSVRFTTTTCRIALHRPLGADAAVLALLARVLESATATAPTREALSERLADLYGAGLHVGIEKRGDAHGLVAQLDWPTAFVRSGGDALADGLTLLREVWTNPVRRADGALDDDIVEVERRNLDRTLVGRRSDKGSWAMHRAVSALCRGEPHGLSALGVRAAVAAVTVRQLADLHADLLRHAPMDIFLIGDLTPDQAVAMVQKHLLWPDRRERPAGAAPIIGVQAAPAVAQIVTEQDDTAQGRLLLGWRGAIRPGTPASDAAAVLSGLLGPGSYGLLFRVVREEHGLCYAIGSQWNTAKGYMLIRTGIAPENTAKALDLIRTLYTQVGAGDFPDETLERLRADMRERVRGAVDSPAALIGWWQTRMSVGLDPSPTAYADALCRIERADVRRVAPMLGFALHYYLGPDVAGEIA